MWYTYYLIMWKIILALFPDSPSNNYKGHKIVIWIFGILTLLMYFRSIIHTFKKDGGAQSIATIPLDTYPTACSKHIVNCFSLWGQQQLLICFILCLAQWLRTPKLKSRSSLTAKPSTPRHQHQGGIFGFSVTTPCCAHQNSNRDEA